MASASAAGGAPGSARAGLGVVFAVVIIDLIGFGIVMPILPLYVRDFGFEGFELGLLAASYSAAQFLCSPLWGRLSDRVGRRPVLLLTVAGTALSLLLFALAPSAPWLFAGRILAGVFAANWSVAAAYVGDVTDEAERTQWMGRLGATFAIGFTLGPALGGILSRHGHATPMLVAAGLSALNFVWALARLRDPQRRHAPLAAAQRSSRREVLRDPAVRLHCGLNFLYSLAVTQLETIFAFFVSERFGFDGFQIAMTMFGMAVVMGGVQGGGMKRLAGRYSERQLVLAGSALLALAFGLLGLGAALAPFVIFLVLAALGRAVLQPGLMSSASQLASDQQRGAVMGAFQSGASLARIPGPLLAGWLFDRWNAAPFGFACCVMVGVALLATRLDGKSAQVRSD